MKAEKTSPSKLAMTQLQRFLLSYRNTPHSTTGISPAEALLGHRLRWPMDLIFHSGEDLIEKWAGKTRRGEVRNFKEGEPVWVRDFRLRANHRWVTGVIAKVLGPATYLVECGGGLWRRHADQVIRRSSQESDENMLMKIPNYEPSKASLTESTTGGIDVNISSVPVDNPSNDEEFMEPDVNTEKTICADGISETVKRKPYKPREVLLEAPLPDLPLDRHSGRLRRVAKISYPK